MKLRARLTILALSTLATTARADMIDEGYKSVRNSIQVNITVPAGKTLVLANTSDGAKILEPDTVNQVSWHPLGGDLQIKLVASDKAEKLPALVEKHDYDAIKKIVDHGIACGAAFPGERVIKDSSPAEEVRWTYRAILNNRDTCIAELLRTEYLDESGKVVTAPVDTTVPLPGIPVGAPKPTRPAPARPEAPKPESGCNTTGAPTSSLALLLLGARLRRRRV